MNGVTAAPSPPDDERQMMYAQQQGGQAATGSAGNYNTPDTVAARQLEVPHQLEAMERNLKGLVGTFADFESRLSNSVLRPEGPQPGSNDAKSQLRGATSTPVGGRLQDFNDALVALRVRIESASVRLEA